MRDAPSIPGVTLGSRIAQRGNLHLFHGSSTSGDAVAVAVQAEPELEEGRRLQRLGAALARVHHPALPATQALGQIGDRVFLVFQDERAPALSDAIARGSLSRDAVVRIARQLAAGLAEIHRVGQALSAVDLQSVVDAASPRFSVLALAAGDQGRCAPQRDSLRHAVEARSNLRSLGTVLEAMGAAKFKSSDPADRALAAVVEKLLRPDPDDGYQTAAGLLADLKALGPLGAMLAQGGPALLGAADNPLSAVAEPLLGRGAELALLLKVWKSAAAGKGSCVVIEGEAGSGKTRLVVELARQARSHGPALFWARGTGEREPLGPVRSAFEGFVRRLRQLPPAHRERDRARLAKALDGLRPLLAPLAGALSLLEGAIAASSPEGEPFFEAVAELLCRLARAFGQAVFAVEDVEQLDEASLRILRKVASRTEEAPLLIVCTAVAGGADAGAMKAALKGLPAVRIALEPLQETIIGQLVAGHLGDPRVPPALLHQVALRSGGNPLAALEVVDALIDSGILALSSGAWAVDLARLEAFQPPRDVLELLTRRLERLGPRVRKVLVAAAVIGPRIRADLLDKISLEPPEQVEAALDEAASARWVEMGEAGTSFAHDCLRDVLLADLAAEERRALHQRAAQALGDSASGEELYALAHHLARGDWKDPKRLWEVSLAAGRQAASDGAFERASQLLEASRDAARAAGIESPETSAALGAAYARLDKAADAVRELGAALALTRDGFERARLRAALSDVYLSGLDTGSARSEVEAAFHEIGRTPPTLREGSWAGTLIDWLAGVVAARFGLARFARERHRLARRTLSSLCSQLTLVCYFDLSTVESALATLRGLLPSVLTGKSRELVSNYSSYCMVQAVLGFPRLSRRYGRLAVELADGLSDPAAQAHARVYRAYAAHVNGDVQEAVLAMEQALEENGRWLEPIHYLSGCADLTWNLLVRGHAREAFEWVDRAIRRADEATGSGGIVHGHTVRLYAGPALAILGRPEEGLAHLERFRELMAKTPDVRWRKGQYLAHRLFYLLERGELGAPAEEAIAEHERLGLDPKRVPLTLRQFYLAKASVRLEQVFASPSAARSAALAAAIGELARAAGRHPTLVGHLLNVRAGLALESGDLDAAGRGLARAESLATRIDAPWALFEATRLQARLAARRGDRAQAQRMLDAARALAVARGWSARAERVG